MRATQTPSLAAPPFSLSLHIRHPSLTPRDISQALKLEAHESFGVGEPRRSRGGTALESMHGETYWAAALDSQQWLATIVPASASRAPREGTASEVKRGGIQHAIDRPMPLDARFARLAMSVLPDSHSLSFVLRAVCGGLYLRHGAFLRPIQDAGGSITLRATAAPRALQGLRILPQVSQWLADLSMALEFECLER